MKQFSERVADHSFVYHGDRVDTQTSDVLVKHISK